MSDLALRVSNIGKRYELGQLGTASDFVRRTRALVRRAMGRGRANGRDADHPWDHETDPNAFWALRGVDFEVHEGEVLGIIGANGAGKSTLLKVLSRITAPTVGRIELFGRVASLLEVGTGFHPELTGRENVYLNGSILGMTRAEITKKFDEIVDFAGVEKFIDTPVKRYSSGMKVRLGFAVAAHLEPEILIVDEVLAVGDAGFQAKCVRKMEEVASSGRTVLFVSHQMGTIQSLCPRVMLLRNGVIREDGDGYSVVARYLRTVESAAETSLQMRKDRRGSGPARLMSVTASSGDAEVSGTLKVGSPARIVFRLNMRILDPAISFTIYDQQGNAISHCNTDEALRQESFRLNGIDEVIWSTDKLTLMPGRYRMNVALNIDNSMQDHVEGALIFDVLEGVIYGRRVRAGKQFGAVILPHNWSVQDAIGVAV